MRAGYIKKVKAFRLYINECVPVTVIVQCCHSPLLLRRSTPAHQDVVAIFRVDEGSAVEVGGDGKGGYVEGVQDLEVKNGYENKVFFMNCMRHVLILALLLQSIRVLFKKLVPSSSRLPVYLFPIQICRRLPASNELHAGQSQANAAAQGSANHQGRCVVKLALGQVGKKEQRKKSEEPHVLGLCWLKKSTAEKKEP